MSTPETMVPVTVDTEHDRRITVEVYFVRVENPSEHKAIAAVLTAAQHRTLGDAHHQAADTIDPPDSNEEDDMTDQDVVRSDTRIGQMRVERSGTSTWVHRDGIGSFFIEPFNRTAVAAAILGIPVDQLDARLADKGRGDVAGYLVEFTNLSGQDVHDLWAQDRDAIYEADANSGTVTALHRGDIIHDATRPVQCPHDGPAQCDRKEHADTIHVALNPQGQLDIWWSDLNDEEVVHPTELAAAAIAAVRDRDEREGR